MKAAQRTSFVAVAVAAAVGAACSSYLHYDFPSTARATGTIAFRADGEAVAELAVEIVMPAYQGRHYALDSVRLDDGVTIWALDPLEVDAADWPVTFDTEYDEERRMLRVVARARPSSVGVVAPRVVIGLVGDDGPVEVVAEMELSQTLDDCSAPTLEDAAASVDVKLAWSASTLDGLVYHLEDVEGDADGVWMAGAAAGTNVPLLRLYRATSAGLGGIKETEAVYADIAVGAPATAVVVTQDLVNEALALRRFDGGLTQLWKHTASAVALQSPVTAVSGGRVALAYMPNVGDALIDGSVVGAATGKPALAMFDEATGELLSWSELPVQPKLLRGASGGAFASATNATQPPTLRVVEADLTERWSVELASTPLALAVTPDGDVWLETAVDVTRYAPDGTEKATYPLPFQGDFAPLPDGSVLFASKNGLGRVTAAGAVTVGELPEVAADWCDLPKQFAIAATGDGAAIAYVPAFDADPVPAYVGKLSP